MDHVDTQHATATPIAPGVTDPNGLAAQYSRERLESGIRTFTLLSWIGGVFGLVVFIFALWSGTPIAAPFLSVAGLMVAYVLLPVVLRLTKRLDLITVIGMLWLVLCMGVGAWSYGGYASAALPWLCAIPILSFYYLRGIRLVVVLLALGLCLAIVSMHHLAVEMPPQKMDAVYGASFAFLLLFLSLASYVFRTAENKARKMMSAALKEAGEARLRAEVANAAKSQFLASVSHELRTPLNAIVGFSDFMRQKNLQPAADAKIPEYAEDIHYSATHLLALINDVLDYSEVGAEQAKAMKADVDLATVVAEALMLVSFQPGARDLTIERHISKDLPMFLGDERRLKQIAVNLLVNAIKFTPKGGRIAVRIALANDGGVNLVVADTGIGIPAKDIDVITQPFFKAANARGNKSAGIGLGLSITSELMQLHDGTLSIESEVGVGTTVTCRFPAARTAARFSARG